MNNVAPNIEESINSMNDSKDALPDSKLIMNDANGSLKNALTNFISKDCVAFLNEVVRLIALLKLMLFPNK